MVLQVVETNNDLSNLGEKNTNDGYIENIEDEAFMRACTEANIPLDVADLAMEHSQATHTKWWNGLRLEEENGKKKDGSSCEDTPEGKQSTQRQHADWRFLPNNPGFSDAAAASMLLNAKRQVVQALHVFRGDTTNPRFLDALNALRSIYTGTGHDSRCHRSQVQFEGNWTTLSRPNFKQCLGRNKRGDFVYTLGRMSFDMFRPAGLRCSIQKIMHDVHVVQEEAERPTSCIPRGLREEVLGHMGVLRTYNIKIFFTIESKDDVNEAEREATGRDADESYRLPAKPIKAVMSNYGYMLPDPNTPNRFTVWFTGGTVAPAPAEGAVSSSSSSSSSPLQTSRSRTAMPSRPERLCQVAIAETSPSGGESCSLPLHECRRKNKQCALHGIDRRAAKKTINDRNKNYVRPRYGPGSNTGLTPSTGLFASAMDGPYSAEWEDIFAPEDTWKRTLGEQAKALAAKVLLGAEVPDHMEDDGSMSFTLHRPIGGHGKSFVDVLYLDKDLRITKGNNGSIFVQTRENTDTRQISNMTSPRRRTVRRKIHGGAA